MEKQSGENLDVQSILSHSSNEKGEFDPEKARKHVVSIARFFADEEIDGLVEESCKILVDSSQWRQFIEALEELHDFQTKRPSVFNLLDPVNFVKYVSYARCRGMLADLFSSSPEHAETFKHLQSRESGLAYVEAISNCNARFEEFKSLFMTILREVDDGFDPNTIKKWNNREIFKVVKG